MWMTESERVCSWVKLMWKSYANKSADDALLVSNYAWYLKELIIFEASESMYATGVFFRFSKPTVLQAMRDQT